VKVIWVTIVQFILENVGTTGGRAYKILSEFSCVNSAREVDSCHLADAVETNLKDLVADILSMKNSAMSVPARCSHAEQKKVGTFLRILAFAG
jgi:hypothetical protein